MTAVPAQHLLIPKARWRLGNQPHTLQPAHPRAQSSGCEAWREVILAKLAQGLSAQRIYQELVAEHGFGGSYYSVSRFVRKLNAKTPLPFRRMECAPGHEGQVDFGTGAPLVALDGKRRRTHLFRIVLNGQRHGQMTLEQLTRWAVSGSSPASRAVERASESGRIVPMT